MNGLVLKRPANPLVQLCACHFVWNSHVIGHAAMAVPFLLHKYLQHASYWDVLYDYLVFVCFVAAPVELSTGIVKGYVTQRRLNWRHRAVMGVACCHVTFFFTLGTYYVRPHSFTLTVLCTFGFYGYASATYLPANPQGQPPEITGSREWPWLKHMLWDFLWDPILRYMQLSIIFDSVVDDASWVGIPQRKAAPDQDALLRAERYAMDAMSELAPLCRGRNSHRAHPFRQIESKLRTAVDALKKELQNTEPQPDDIHGLEVGEAVILGYHPHGIIPFNAAMMTMCHEFQLPTRCVVAVDAFVHAVLWMRDLGQWLGARECTREAMGRALEANRSVVLVPGGQAEIFTTHSWGPKVVIYRGHKGFVRLALAQRKRLVPVMAFGEWELMELLYWPKTQAITRRLFGFPFPFMPIGRFGLPLPRRPPRGVTTVVGQPLDVEDFLDTSIHPDDPRNIDNAVTNAHAAYFDRLNEIFERYKVQAGYPHHYIEFHDAAQKSSDHPSRGRPSSSGGGVLSGGDKSQTPPPFLLRNASSIDDFRSNGCSKPSS